MALVIMYQHDTYFIIVFIIYNLSCVYLCRMSRSKIHYIA